MKKIIIGIDIGGTTVKIGLIDTNGSTLDKWEVPTRTENNGLFIVDDIWESIQLKLNDLNIDKKMILGIGAGAPGFVDTETGVVHEAVNIGWKRMRLGNELMKRSGLPAFIQNDANLAALGEYWKGAGNQAQNLAAITLGTGVGSGFIANGSIIPGANGMAGEIGHFIINSENGYLCNCGNYGCLETIASATGIVRQAMDRAAAHPEDYLADYVKRNGKFSAKDVFYLAEQGSKECLEIVKRTADALGFTVATIGIIFNPSKVLIGGGVSKAGDLLINQIKLAFKKYAFQRISDICEIKACELGNDAGIIGAGYLVRQRLMKITE